MKLLPSERTTMPPDQITLCFWSVTTIPQPEFAGRPEVAVEPSCTQKTRFLYHTFFEILYANLRLKVNGWSLLSGARPTWTPIDLRYPRVGMKRKKSLL